MIVASGKKALILVACMSHEHARNVQPRYEIVNYALTMRLPIDKPRKLAPKIHPEIEYYLIAALSPFPIPDEYQHRKVQVTSSNLWN